MQFLMVLRSLLGRQESATVPQPPEEEPSSPACTQPVLKYNPHVPTLPTRSSVPLLPEIWMMIFSYYPAPDEETEFTSETTLDYITLTCKTFRDLAQPLFFRTASIWLSSGRVCRIPGQFDAAKREWIEIKPFGLRMYENMVAKMSFLAEDRIARGLRTCRLVPSLYSNSAVITYDPRVTDPDEDATVEVFFRELLPKLVNLKDLQLAHMTLRSPQVLWLSSLPACIQSLTIESCCIDATVPKSLQSRVVSLPVKNLMVGRCLVTEKARNVYFPLPHPAHIESLTYRVGTSTEAPSPEPPLLSRLNAMGECVALRSLQVEFFPTGVSQDWFHFLSNCSALERLSISQNRSGSANTIPATSPVLPWLKVFRGTWDDAMLCALPQRSLRHLCLPQPQKRLGDVGQNPVLLSCDDVLSGLAQMKEGFMLLESLDIIVHGWSERFLIELFTSCPRLRAVKLACSQDDSAIQTADGIKDLRSILKAVSHAQDMEFVVFQHIYIKADEQNMLERTIQSSANAVEKACPRLRRVRVSFRLIGSNTGGVLCFVPGGRPSVPGERTFDDWRHANGL